MKLLVLATDYPKKNESVALMYVHTRNKYYVQNGIDVTVVNFKAKENYTIDDVKVITLAEYERKKNNNYDILVSHAPNIRNHYMFLRKYESKFSDIVFFFHGHEVLRTSEIYPKSYDYLKKTSVLTSIITELYDSLKLKIWKNYFRKILHKSQFVFVSNWMYNMFLKYVQIDEKLIKPRKHIIYNCVGRHFENNTFDKETDKDYDFITIRNNLDDSKYAIDVVTKIAKTNPRYKFCVIGKGRFYQQIEKPNNLHWLNSFLSHDKVIQYLNKSRCALMPTRADAQGVMACEMVTFGIPLITSNIAVCEEVFSGFGNVEYINNEAEEINIELLYQKLARNKNDVKWNKYFAKSTIGKEIELLKDLKRNV